MESMKTAFYAKKRVTILNFYDKIYPYVGDVIYYTM